MKTEHDYECQVLFPDCICLKCKNDKKGCCIFNFPEALCYVEKCPNFEMEEE